MPNVWLTVLGWVVGISTYASVGPIGIAAVLLCGGWGAFFIQRKIVGLLCLVVVAGAVRMAAYDALPLLRENEWARELQIVDIRRDWHVQRLTLRSTTGWGAVLELPDDDLLQRGMVVRVDGAFRPFIRGEHPYTDSLIRQHIVGSITPHDPPVVVRADDWRIALERNRRAAQNVIRRTFHEPVAGVVVGMLLGISSDIDPTIAAAFRRSGTSHILVISGWNITIVAALCQQVLRRCAIGGTAALVIPIALIAVYVLFTGASAAVVRAGVMGVVIVVGKWVERPRDLWNIIAVAVFGMSAADPTALWDLGFQLSTAATFGLVVYGTPVDAWLARTSIGHRSLDWAREGLAATLAAQIPTLPIMVCRLGIPSPWSLLANMIITPVVPYAMASGTLATIVAAVLPALGSLLSWSAIPAYHWIIDGSRALAALPTPGLAAVERPWLEWVGHALWVAHLCWRERVGLQRWYSSNKVSLKER
ncbi:MAG: hypothetical protein RLZZ297_903 [Chloroflexota bacterium]